MKWFKLTLFVLLIFTLAIAALPVFADGAEATEVPDNDAVVLAPVADGESGFLNFLNFLNILGIAYNSFPGGFLTAAGILVFTQKFAGNREVLRILEKQYDNLANSYPPQTIELLRERLGQFGDALEGIGKSVKEITDGVPVDSKQAKPNTAEVG